MKMIDLGDNLGRLDTSQPALTVVSPVAHSEAYYTPAMSIRIYGRTCLINLRDALNEAYPIQDKGRPE